MNPTDPIPIAAIDLGAEAEALVLEVLRSGRLVQGPMVERFEMAFASLCGVRHAIAVTNGTVSLAAALEASGVGEGDEVITTPFTFVATLNAILGSGATARFADIDLDTFTMGADAADALVNTATRALLPVHLYGQPADMDTLSRLAVRHELAIIEDAAQAHGATFGGRGVGSFGVGSFSFYATKNITTGEGGMVTTDDDDTADQIRLLRNQGMRSPYHYERPGHNYRLTEMQAALAIPQLAHIQDLIAKRQANAARLSDGLISVPGLLVPLTTANRTHVWHQYTIRVTSEARMTRDALVSALQGQGIGAAIYYPKVVFDYACYRDHPRVHAGFVPNAQLVATEVVSLPVHPGVTPEGLDRIIDSVVGLLA